MTEEQFRKLLKDHRYHACLLLARAKVDEWDNDGTPEIVRCLTCSRCDARLLLCIAYRTLEESNRHPR